MPCGPEQDLNHNDQALLEQLQKTLELQGEDRAVEGEQTVRLRATRFRPWWGQRMVMRSEASCRVLVCSRQVGKSLSAVHFSIQTALEQPGSYSVLLAPTYVIARTAIDLMQIAIREIPGAQWKEQLKRVLFPNGSVWQVFSADRKDAARSPKLDGLLWVDEAAYMPKRAWTAALGAMGAAKSPKKLLTTTPAGKNWVYDEFVSDDPNNEPFRFRSSDSPYTNQEEVATNRKKMTPERAAQEFDAEFVDALLLAFPNTDRLFVPRLPDRSQDSDLRNTLGIDLGRDQDWTVCTLMNKYGEAELVGRWQHVSWPETESRILELIADRGVGLCCIDKSFVGGYLIDRLEAQGQRVLGVATNARGEKARIVETARADVQHERVWVLEGPEANQLRYELSRFQGTRKILQGREVVTYECPQLRGEHDDCVISLCLANWGRTHGWDCYDGEVEDITEYTRAAERMIERRQNWGSTGIIFW